MPLREKELRFPSTSMHYTFECMKPNETDSRCLSGNLELRSILQVAEIKMFSCVFDSDHDKHHSVPDA